jgi:glycosyltransferase involved in cell wall biosynthesis
VSGIPAIVSSVGGLPEAVGAGGVVVDRDAAIAEWVSALSRLWDDPVEYQRHVANAQEHARRPAFQPAAIVEIVVAALNSVRGQ